MSGDWTDGFGTLCDNELPASTDSLYDGWGDSWSGFDSSWTAYEDSSSCDTSSSSWD